MKFVSNQFQIESLRIGPEKNFCYLIECPSTGACALVDPAFELEKIKSHFFDSQPRRRLVYLIATHGHWDHAGGLAQMKNLFPDAKTVAGFLERSRIENLCKIPLEIGLKDNDTLSLGNGTIQALHTPGHTEGGTCFLVDPYVLTGDTLFVSLCGRTDLAGGSDADLFQSLQKLKKLNGELIILPGHDYGPEPTSTIAREIQTNPSMMAKNLQEFSRIP